LLELFIHGCARVLTPPSRGRRCARGWLGMMRPNEQHGTGGWQARSAVGQRLRAGGPADLIDRRHRRLRDPDDPRCPLCLSVGTVGWRSSTSCGDRWRTRRNSHGVVRNHPLDHGRRRDPGRVPLYTQLENRVLNPVIMSRTVKVNRCSCSSPSWLRLGRQLDRGKRSAASWPRCSPFRSPARSR